MVFKNLCILVLWMKVALALEGLRICRHAHIVNVSCQGHIKDLPGQRPANDIDIKPTILDTHNKHYIKIPALPPGPAGGQSCL